MHYFFCVGLQRVRVSDPSSRDCPALIIDRINHLGKHQGRHGSEIVDIHSGIDAPDRRPEGAMDVPVEQPLTPVAQAKLRVTVSAAGIPQIGKITQQHLAPRRDLDRGGKLHPGECAHVPKAGAREVLQVPFRPKTSLASRRRGSRPQGVWCRGAPKRFQGRGPCRPTPSPPAPSRSPPVACARFHRRMIPASIPALPAQGLLQVSMMRPCPKWVSDVNQVFPTVLPVLLACPMHGMEPPAQAPCSVFSRRLHCGCFGSDEWAIPFRLFPCLPLLQCFRRPP